MEDSEHIIDMEIMEATAPQKLTLAEILIAVFTSPAKGTLKILSTKHSNSGVLGTAFMLVFGIVVSAVLYLMKEPDKILHIIKLGLSSVIFTLFIAIFTYITNAVAKRTDFRKALLTGGIIGLILSVLLIVIYLASLMGANLMNAVSPIWGNNAEGRMIWVWLFVFVYTFMLVFNVLTQSLRAGNDKDGASFYLSPVILVFAFYLTVKIAHIFINM